MLGTHAHTIPSIHVAPIHSSAIQTTRPNLTCATTSASSDCGIASTTSDPQTPSSAPSALLHTMTPQGDDDDDEDESLLFLLPPPPLMPTNEGDLEKPPFPKPGRAPRRAATTKIAARANAHRPWLRRDLAPPLSGANSLELLLLCDQEEIDRSVRAR